MTADDVLAGRSATRPVRALIALAAAKDLRPDVATSTRRGLYLVCVEGHGEGALFGGIYISRRSGKFACAYLTQGNDGAERRYERLADVRAILREQVQR